jgi:DNA-binding protein H-NS
MIMAQTAYNLDDLPREEILVLCEAILPRLPAADLKWLRDQAEQYRRDKLEDAKNEILARMRSEFDKIGLPMDEVVDVSKGRPQRKQLPPKYISPDGKTWSGKGNPPRWMRELEDAGHERDEFLIPVEE